ncbi:MAG TPA: ABC transporter permease [Acidimicrobiales bacterium]|jgi:lipopolysaccharide transport system permease protein|nr:ABC transporter permease [Acidimicrobiales bacterium]
MATIVITPPRKFSLPKIKQLWEAREVLYRFGARDVTLRYRQTLLGVVWVILQPLLTALIFAVVFGKVAKLPSGGVPYVVFAFAGLLAWNLFNGIITRAATSLVSNRDLVSKVFFPRMLVPLSTSVSTITDFFVSVVFMAVLLVVYGIRPGVAIVLFPVWTVLVILLASGCGLVAGALQVRYRDIAYVVPFALQFLLYASPVGYAVPKHYELIYNLNPLTWILNEFRWSFLHQPAPPSWQIVASLAVAITVFIAGVLIFEQMERGFADVI